MWKRNRCRDGAGISKVLLCALSVLALALDAHCQLINDWTNPASAKWESSSWSLGILPASNQTVNITNAGYKAVAIDNATFSGYPDSLTVSNLTISAPANGLSTLLLNYAETATPLKILSGCTIGTNGALDNYQSSFEVDGTNGGELLLDGGTFAQEGGQTVVNGPVDVLNGSIDATNANLTLGEVTLGSAVAASSGYFNQNGGNVAAQSIDIEQGTYDLILGVLYAGNGTQCSTPGLGFLQFGGTNYGNIIATDGYYELSAGLAQGNTLNAEGDGNATLFEQQGGLLDMQFINVTAGSNYPPELGPIFNGGVVHCGTLNIGGNGRAELNGADFFVTNNFVLQGMVFVVGDEGFVITHADFLLNAGNLYLPSMSLGEYGTFDQASGSNEISGGLSMVGGTYFMAGGTLETTYTGVGAAATFTQDSGQHLVHGVLSITGSYTETGKSDAAGCNLVCEGLYLRGALSLNLYFNGLYFDPAATFTNTGLLDLGGTMTTGLPDAEAGQVELATNALVAFVPGFPAVLRFANSSAVAWKPGALLIVTNWSSSDHLFAGTDATGLSASQLQQVEFSNPAGFAPGACPAQILSTGEIVPAQRPVLAVARMPNALVLSWSGNYQLLSASNVTGPFLPIAGASSPWTNLFSQPHQFFELASP
jgi:hypothetical protein